jgi:S-DNA-T family DNA segregation ATPase FtsK/SpoIIIE
MASKSTASRWSSGWGAAFWLGLVAIGLLLALGSYHPEDPSFSTFSSHWQAPHNVLGYFGSWLADIFFQLLGHGAWLVPGLLCVAVARWLVAGESEPILGGRWWAGLGFLTVGVTLAVDLAKLGLAAKNAFPPQGLAGLAVSSILRPLFGTAGSYLAAVVLFWCFSLVWWESLPVHCVRALTFVGNALGKFGWMLLGLTANAGREIARGFWAMFRSSREAKKAKTQEKATKPARAENAVVAAATATAKGEDDDDEEDEADEDAAEEVAKASGGFRLPFIRKGDKETPKERRRASASRRQDDPAAPWELPPLSLLEHSKKKTKVLSNSELQGIAQKITNALQSFEIEGEVVEVSPGPIITMYEFQPAPGIRAQKIMSASTDLAMTLGVTSVRIVAPIPGKSVAGIEVPNPDKEEIVLRDVYESTNDKAKSMKVPLVMGKDGEGNPIIEDLSRMPHLLIGGATSMGKSVLVNSILTSLLCRFTPEELRLIIVDPKLVEFKAFEDIPHLMLPIVNDPADASQSLKWAVSETKRRYLLMQKHGAKNIDGYNAKVPELEKMELREGEKKPTKFPYIVIIIDELAELMLTGKKDVEQSIVRLSQLARAAGIHLIMSTQRPSADVVTGLIKSNCPSRVALRVASASDSRIILDCAGAEQLIGRGDMFFTNTGPMGLRRMQGAYVSDGEIEKICEFWRSQGEPDYKDDILAPETAEQSALNEAAEGLDTLYAEVIDFAKEKGRISTSLIQRRFSIGYTRAARIMEQLEQRGIVGEAAAAGKARDVIL